MAADEKLSVQVFGYRDSRPTQQAIRFFRERAVALSFVDLDRRPMARSELLRFAQKFGALTLLDDASRAYREAGLGYMRLDADAVLERLLANPRLIRLPLARAGNRLSFGASESVWREWTKSP